MKSVYALLAVVMVAQLISSPTLAAEKKKDKVCKDDCYSHCVKRVENKFARSVPGCQRACQRSHRCNE
jgi:hypothetical protein